MGCVRARSLCQDTDGTELGDWGECKKGTAKDMQGIGQQIRDGTAPWG